MEARVHRMLIGIVVIEASSQSTKLSSITISFSVASLAFWGFVLSVNNRREVKRAGEREEAAL